MTAPGTLMYGVLTDRIADHCELSVMETNPFG